MRPDSDTNFAFAFLAFAQHASIFASSPERKNKPRETCDVAGIDPLTVRRFYESCMTKRVFRLVNGIYSGLLNLTPEGETSPFQTAYAFVLSQFCDSGNTLARLTACSLSLRSEWNSDYRRKSPLAYQDSIRVISNSRYLSRSGDLPTTVRSHFVEESLP